MQEWLGYLGKGNIGECTAGQPRAGTGWGDGSTGAGTKGIRHAASPGGTAGSRGWLWAQHPTVLQVLAGQGDGLETKTTRPGATKSGFRAGFYLH